MVRGAGFKPVGVERHSGSIPPSGRIVNLVAFVGTLAVGGFFGCTFFVFFLFEYKFNILPDKTKVIYFYNRVMGHFGLEPGWLVLALK